MTDRECQDSRFGRLGKEHLGTRPDVVCTRARTGRENHKNMGTLRFLWNKTAVQFMPRPGHKNMGTLWLLWNYTDVNFMPRPDAMLITRQQSPKKEASNSIQAQTRRRTYKTCSILLLAGCLLVGWRCFCGLDVRAI